jgi:hypothetical protein
MPITGLVLKPPRGVVPGRKALRKLLIGSGLIFTLLFFIDAARAKQAQDSAEKNQPVTFEESFT